MPLSLQSGRDNTCSSSRLHWPGLSEKFKTDIAQTASCISCLEKGLMLIYDEMKSCDTIWICS